MTEESDNVYRPINGYPIENEEISWRTATYDICNIELNHSHQELARAGFIWSSEQGRPRCAYCHILLSSEDEQAEDLIERHILRNRECLFVAPFTQVPVHEEWQDQAKRLSSLSDSHWPGSTGIEISEQGLFKCPATQRIMCYQCGAVFASWELWCAGMPNMMVWQLHAQKQRACAHVIKTRGIDFVETSQAVDSSSEDEYSLTDEESEARDDSWWRDRSQGQASDSHREEQRVEDGEAIIDMDTISDEDLRNNTRCKVCLQNMSQILFLPCRHLAACSSCAQHIRNECHYCRQRIVARIVVFLV